MSLVPDVAPTEDLRFVGGGGHPARIGTNSCFASVLGNTQDRVFFCFCSLWGCGVLNEHGAEHNLLFRGRAD